eukprot:UN18827
MRQLGKNCQNEILKPKHFTQLNLRRVLIAFLNCKFFLSNLWTLTTHVFFSQKKLLILERRTLPCKQI